jgi:SAM-dependent methyltransferase
MKPVDIGKAYDQIAERWASNEFPRENGIEAHERAIAFVGTKRHALDIGCGSNDRFIELLLAHRFEVEAIDVSSRMVELARQQHPDIPIHNADIREWTFRRKYDLISAWDSLWHVPLRDQEEILRRILHQLTAKGVYIFTTGGMDEPGEKVDAFMGPEMYYSSLGLPRTLAVISEAGCVCRHLEYDRFPESHVYIIAQRD